MVVPHLGRPYRRLDSETEPFPTNHDEGVVAYLDCVDVVAAALRTEGRRYW
jgi:hypothetical protein